MVGTLRHWTPALLGFGCGAAAAAPSQVPVTARLLGLGAAALVAVRVPRRSRQPGSTPEVAAERPSGRVREEVQALLEERSLGIAFQPILSVESGRLVGAEALARFPHHPHPTPDVWFSRAAEVGLGVELELLAVEQALAAAAALPPDIHVALNVSPTTLGHPDLLTVVSSGPVALERLVLEVTEHAGVTDYEDLRDPVARLRAAGVRLAVDDAGAGYASFRHILRLAPEVIKLDRSLVAGIDHDPARRALAAAVVMFGLEMDATIIAEGLETVEELRAAQAIGIDWAQGFLFGRPNEDWSTWSEWHAAGSVFSVRAAGHSAPEA